jgi:hypothetical protein
MTKDRFIGWEKWRDPFGEDAEDAEWPGAHGTFTTDKIIKSATVNGIHEDDDFEDDDDDFSSSDIDEAIHEHQRQQLQGIKKTPMIATPMGLIPMTEHTRAGKLFNFWTAHTNFPITQEIKDIIDRTDGVETLDIFTRYRWRISIGKAFNSPEVKSNLMKALGAKPLRKSKKHDRNNKKEP